MWRDLNRDGLGGLKLLNDLVLEAERSARGRTPDFSSSPTLLITSDYSGANKESRFDTYSFLVLSPRAWNEWEPRRLEMRAVLGMDRTISFKRLGDRKRRAVLADFLVAAGLLQGLSFSLLVDKRMGTLFKKDICSPIDALTDWKAGSLEKLYRVIHILGLLIAGLSHQGQDVLWITDEDEIAANARRLTDITQLVANVSSHLLQHDLRHLRCGTSASDNGTKQLEDLVAIPDMVGGAITEMISKTGLPGHGLFIPSPDSLSPKARILLQWFADSSLPLYRIVVAAEPAGEGLTMRRLRFHWSDDQNYSPWLGASWSTLG